MSAPVAWVAGGLFVAVLALVVARMAVGSRRAGRVLGAASGAAATLLVVALVVRVLVALT